MRVLLALLSLRLSFAAVFTTQPLDVTLPRDSTQTLTTSHWVQGSGSAFSNANHLMFTWKSGEIHYGDRIAFFVWNTDAGADVNVLDKEYPCDGTQEFLLEIAPTENVNATHQVMQASLSPQKSPVFGALRAGAYKLCYCRPKRGESCRTQDFKYSVGLYYSVEVPRVQQLVAVNINKQWNRFSFEVPTKSIPNGGVLDPVKLSVAIMNAPNFCGNRPKFESTPQWQGATAGDTSTSQELTLVRMGSDYTVNSVSMVGYNIPLARVDDKPIKAQYYYGCLCAEIVKKTGNCKDDGKSSTNNKMYNYPVEIVKILAHDLVFLVSGKKSPVVSITDLQTGDMSKVPISFFHSSSTNMFPASSTFWFARSDLDCEADLTKNANAMTKTYFLGNSNQPQSIDLKDLKPTKSVFTNFRLCVKNSEVMDLKNVFFVHNGVKATVGSVSDKIGDTNGIPVLDPNVAKKLISMSDSTKWTSLQVDRLGYVWSDNFVEVNISWPSGSLEVNDQIFAVRDTVPCSFSDPSASTSAKYRTDVNKVTVSSSAKSFLNLTLDLGQALHTSVTIDFESTNLGKQWPEEKGTKRRNYPFGLSAVGDNNSPLTGFEFTKTPDATPLESADLARRFTLCALRAGDSNTGVELGFSFQVLAALHVVSANFKDALTTIFSGQASHKIIIASGPAFKAGKSVFLAEDVLWFARTDKACTDADPSINNNPQFTSSSTKGSTDLYKPPSTVKLDGLESIMAATEVTVSWPPTVHPGMYRLCVRRNQDVHDFPGCAVSVESQTSQPTQGPPGALPAKEFAVSPSFSQTGVPQKFKFSAVFNNTHFGTSYSESVSSKKENSFYWNFVNGPTPQGHRGRKPSVLDRLSVSELGTGVSTEFQCDERAYSYQTVPAFVGEDSVGVAKSGVLNGMVPGVYAVCLCNYGFPENDPADCTNTMGYRQFVGFVVFDGTYEHTTLAAHPGDKITLPVKLTSASPLDGMVLTAQTCDTEYFTSADSNIATAYLSNPSVLRTHSPSVKTGSGSPTMAVKKDGKEPFYSRLTNSPTTANYKTWSTTKTKAPATRTPTAPVTGRRRRRRLLATTLSPTGAYNKGGTASPTIGVVGGRYPYVVSQLASQVNAPQTAGMYQICYCWNPRYSNYQGSRKTPHLRPDKDYEAYKKETGKFDLAVSNDVFGAKKKLSDYVQTAKNGGTAAKAGIPADIIVGNNNAGEGKFSIAQYVAGASQTRFCGTGTQSWQGKYRTHVGDFLVHNVRMWGLIHPTANTDPRFISKMAVAVSQYTTIRFSADPQDRFSMSNFNSIKEYWWAKHRDSCLSAANTVKRVPTTNPPEQNEVYSKGFHLQFDFTDSNYYPGVCTAQEFDYEATLEDQFFYRLCVKISDTVVYDYRNVMITLTDIQVRDEFSNGMIATGDMYNLKFQDACGFNWLESRWEWPSIIRFVDSTQDCTKGFPSATTTDIDAPATDANSKAYTSGLLYSMYDRSLANLFYEQTKDWVAGWDLLGSAPGGTTVKASEYSDNTFSLRIKFPAAAGLKFRKAWRLCIAPQIFRTNHASTQGGGWDAISGGKKTFGQLDTAMSNYLGKKSSWIDYPHVTIFPYAKDDFPAEISVQHANYDSESNCHAGNLGCKCSQKHVMFASDPTATPAPAAQTLSNFCFQAEEDQYEKLESSKMVTKYHFRPPVKWYAYTGLYSHTDAAVKISADTTTNPFFNRKRFIFAKCDVAANLCVAPVQQLTGELPVTDFKQRCTAESLHTEWATKQKCNLPGPSKSTTAKIFLQKNGNYVEPNDLFWFRQVGIGCEDAFDKARSFLKPQAHTTCTTGFTVRGTSESQVYQIDTSQLASDQGKWYRLCGRTPAGALLDYSRTRFQVVGTPASTGGGKKTFAPTVAFAKTENKAGIAREAEKQRVFGSERAPKTKTLSPTVVNPLFKDQKTINQKVGTDTGGPVSGDVVQVSAGIYTNRLHITSEMGNQRFYTKWSNFTSWGTDKTKAMIGKDDTLRVYRYTGSAITSSFRKDALETHMHPNDLCSTQFGAGTPEVGILETSDLVMEIKINSKSEDTKAGGKAGDFEASPYGDEVKTVVFPALPKGYYTTCFCRKTANGFCDMELAGFIYVTPIVSFSALVSGEQDASTNLFPLTDIEITLGPTLTGDMWCATYIKHGFTCNKNLCNKDDISLTATSHYPAGVKLVVVAKKKTSKVFALCHSNPMAGSDSFWDPTNKRMTTYFRDEDHGMYWNRGRFGTLYVGTVTLVWSQNDGFPKPAYMSSPGTTAVQKTQDNLLAKVAYAAADSTNNIIAQHDLFWFAQSGTSCYSSTIDSKLTTQYSVSKVPATGRSVVVKKGADLLAGFFYRMCLYPNYGSSTNTNVESAKVSNVRDFGERIGFWVTRITASAVNFHWFRSFHVTITETEPVGDLERRMLQERDEIALVHMKFSCDAADGSRGRAMTKGVWQVGKPNTINFGKVPQVLLFESNPLKTSIKTSEQIALTYAAHRLCVTRVVENKFSTADPKTSHKFFTDLGGIWFFPESSNKLLQTTVAKADKQTVQLSSISKRVAAAADADIVGDSRYDLWYGHTIQNDDKVWFQSVTSGCSLGTITSNEFKADPVSDLQSSNDRSSRVKITRTHFPVDTAVPAQVTGSVKITGLDFRQVEATKLHLCVQKSSIPESTQVHEYRDVVLHVVSSDLATTKQPTPFSTLQNVARQNPAGPIKPKGNQVISVFPGTSSFSWRYDPPEATLDKTADKIAVVVKLSTDYFTCSQVNSGARQPLLLLGLNTSASGLATTDSFPSVPLGQYLVCFCDASASPTKDCTSEVGWTMDVGLLYSFSTPPQDVAVFTNGQAVSTLLLTLNQKVTTTMRLMVVKPGTACGTTVGEKLVSGGVELEKYQPTVVDTWGFKLEQKFRKDMVGVYQMCFCAAFSGGCFFQPQPFTYAPFGGSFGSLVLHDILLNGRQAISVFKGGAHTSSNLTITQSLFTSPQTKFWFSNIPCGDASPTSVTTNTTAVTAMPKTGDTVVLDYKHIDPSPTLFTMCVLSGTRVHTISGVGIIFTDFTVEMTSTPAIPAGEHISPKLAHSSTQSVKFVIPQNSKSYVFSLSPPTPTPPIMVFVDTKHPCSGVTVAASKVAKSEKSTDSRSFQFPTSTNAAWDFSGFTKVRTVTRLCVCSDVATTKCNVDWLDYTSITLNPVDDNTKFTVLNPLVWQSATVSTMLIKYTTLPFYSTNSPPDVVYFRLKSKPCVLTVPVDAFTSTAAKFSQAGGTPFELSFSRVTETHEPLRMCVVFNNLLADSTSRTEVLDYGEKLVHVSGFQLTTKSCSVPHGTSSGRCVLSYTGVGTHQDAFMQNNDQTLVWFEKHNIMDKSVHQCSTQVSTAGPDTSSTNMRSSVVTLQNAGESGGGVEFQSGNLVAAAYYQMCAYSRKWRSSSPVQNAVVNLFDVSVQESAASGAFVTPSATATLTLRSKTTLTALTFTWWQKSSEECAVPAAATATSTAMVQVSQSLESGTKIAYDFSQVQPVAGEEIAFRLCSQNSAKTQVSDISSVVVHVLEFVISPEFVSPDASQSVTIFPNRKNKFDEYTFCKVGSACVFSLSATADCSSRAVTPQALDSGTMQFDFSPVKSEGKLFRLCARDRRRPDSGVTESSIPSRGVYIGRLATDKHVTNFAKRDVQITYETVLTAGDEVWYQHSTRACEYPAASSWYSTVATKLTASPATHSFDFAGFLQEKDATTEKKYASLLKLCAKKSSGGLQDFGATSVGMTILQASVDAGSVSAKTGGAAVKITYSSVNLGGDSRKAFFSSHPKCTTGTPAVDSVSGQVHTLDFSNQDAKEAPYHLCLQGTITLAVPFASLFVVDVADLGTKTVANAVSQSLKLSAPVSLKAGDVVFFSSACAGSAERSSTVSYSIAESQYSLSFSNIAPSLTPVSMCVTRGAATMSYSSVSVTVVPMFDLGGPYMTGASTRSVSLASGEGFFPAGTQVGFAVGGSTCATASMVPYTKTVQYPFEKAGAYSLCAKIDGQLLSFSLGSVQVSTCAEICPPSRADQAAGCDAVAGTCKQCTSHFAGALCNQCNMGYVGTNCDRCDKQNNFECLNSKSSTDSCALDQVCQKCWCNGHHDATATPRCPDGKCVCDQGYTGAQCESCSSGFFKVDNTTAKTFVCQNCADRCNKRAATCGSAQGSCACTGEWDPATDCSKCKAGLQPSADGTACVQPPAPTAAPSTAPTAAKCKSDTAQYASSCVGWVENGFCEDATYSNFMKQNCDFSCNCAVKLPQCAFTAASDLSASMDASACKGWVAKGYCFDSRYRDYMSKNCPYSCDIQVMQKCKDYCTDTAIPKPSKEPAKCANWAKSNYCTNAVYRNYMNANCAWECYDPCTGDNAAYSASCPGWKASGYCQNTSQYFPFMEKNCAGTCRGVAAKSAAACPLPIDNGSCAAWKKQGYCTNNLYARYMRVNCFRTCACTN